MSSFILNTTFEESLNKYAKSKGLINIKLTVKPATEKGDNFIGILLRATVSGLKNRNHEEIKCIVKKAPTSIGYRKHFDMNLYFVKEIFTYTDILSKFHKLQSEYHIDENERFNYAECFTCNKENLNEFIVLKDLNDNYQMHEPRLHPLDYNHMIIALKTLARYNALSYVLKETDPVFFNEATDFIVEPLFSLQKPHVVIKKHIEVVSKMFVDAFKDKPEYDSMINFTSNIYENIAELLEPNKYSVIGHGDYWKNNIMFQYDQNKIPTSAIPIDYQNIRYTSPGIDILYLIFTCTTQELRKQHYKHFLDVYYQTMRSYMGKFLINIDRFMSESEFYDEMKRVGRFGFAMSLWVLPFICCVDNEIPDIVELLYGDLKIKEASFAILEKMIYAVLQDCIEFGYL